jgi:ABC-type Fe3+-siderophore transport system permease subunit
MLRALAAAVIGALLGIAGAYVQSVGSWTLLPWALGGIAIGYVSPKRGAMFTGAAYGFALAFAFMIAAYTGAAPVRTRLPAFALLGLVGAVCGAVLSLAASSMRARTARSVNQ